MSTGARPTVDGEFGWRFRVNQTSLVSNPNQKIPNTYSIKEANPTITRKKHMTNMC
jgi:hypothetical protein